MQPIITEFFEVVVQVKITGRLIQCINHNGVKAKRFRNL